jgi:hypothetical protein
MRRNGGTLVVAFVGCGCIERLAGRIGAFERVPDYDLAFIARIWRCRIARGIGDVHHGKFRWRVPSLVSGSVVHTGGSVEGGVGRALGRGLGAVFIVLAKLEGSRAIGIRDGAEFDA